MSNKTTTTAILSQESRSENSNPPAMFSTSGDYGMQVLAQPVDADVDIVFVHGLTGNRTSTWTSKPGAHGQAVFWPAQLLPPDFPAARIMTFGYDADIVGWQMASSNGIRKHGMSLAYAILGQRKTAEVQKRPLVFVAHSLGGLISEQAFLLCRGAEELQPIFQNTRGFLFLGTPHDGSPHATYASGIATFTNLFRRSNRDLLKALDAQSETTRAVEEDWYLEVKKKNGFIHVHCFAEAVAMNLVGKIVPENSAVLKGFPYNTIHADHSGMTKFANANDEGYRLVTDVLKRWIDEFTMCHAQPETTLEPAPAAGLEHLEAGETKKESSSQGINSKTSNTESMGSPTINNNGRINAKTVLQGITANNGTFTF